jgi:hypothetical protein
VIRNNFIFVIYIYIEFLFLPNNSYITKIYIAGAEAKSYIISPGQRVHYKWWEKIKRRKKEKREKSRQTEGTAGVPETFLSTPLIFVALIFQVVIDLF